MNLLKEIGKLAAALLIQVLLFNNLHFMGICFPYVYIAALICLPVMSRPTEMLIGFATGLLMDMFCSSPGMHTAACVLITWLRPVMLSRMVQEYERVTIPVSGASIGVAPFVRLAVTLCLLHHAVVFLMDDWSLLQPGWLFLRWTVSSAMSLLFILGYGLTRKP
jgi:rod shape-determining protein MreD